MGSWALSSSRMFSIFCFETKMQSGLIRIYETRGFDLRLRGFAEILENI